MPRLLLLSVLLGFPLVELVVLIYLAHRMGWWLLLWLVLAAVTGLALMRDAKLQVFGRIVSGADREAQLASLLRGARTVLAGVLLIIPGVISDLIALALLLIPRPALAPAPAPVHDGHGTVIEGQFRRE